MNAIEIWAGSCEGGAEPFYHLGPQHNSRLTRGFPYVSVISALNQIRASGRSYACEDKSKPAFDIVIEQGNFNVSEQYWISRIPPSEVIAVSLIFLLMGADKLTADASDLTQIEQVQIACPGEIASLGENLTHWFESDAHFNLDSKELGWREWSKEIYGYLGLPESAGNSLHAAVKLSEEIELHYDSLSWGRVDLDGDARSELVVISSLLQGIEHPFNVYSLYVFCETAANTGNRARYKLCGAVSYDPRFSVTTLPIPWAPGIAWIPAAAPVQDPNVAYVTAKGRTRSVSIVAVSANAMEGGQPTVRWDGWKLERQGLTYFNACP